MVLVISEKSETVWNRRPALVGLRLRSGHRFLSLEQFDAVALGEGDDGALGVGPLAEGAGAAVALRLPLRLSVFTFTTRTLKIVSTASRISGLLASGWTLNV